MTAKEFPLEWPLAVGVRGHDTIYCPRCERLTFGRRWHASPRDEKLLHDRLTDCVTCRQTLWRLRQPRNSPAGRRLLTPRQNPTPACLDAFRGVLRAADASRLAALGSPLASPLTNPVTSGESLLVAARLAATLSPGSWSASRRSQAGRGSRVLDWWTDSSWLAFKDFHHDQWLRSGELRIHYASSWSVKPWRGWLLRLLDLAVDALAFPLGAGRQGLMAWTTAGGGVMAYGQFLPADAGCLGMIREIHEIGKPDRGNKGRHERAALKLLQSALADWVQDQLTAPPPAASARRLPAGG